METEPQPAQTADRIERRTLLHAPLNRVWRAISEAKEFGTWFGVKLDGQFSAGAKVTGKITPTKVDRDVAKLQKEYEGMAFDLTVDRIEPERLFSFRWHPFASDPHFDFNAEPMTLVSFTLEEAEGGVLLTVTESGFDRLAPKRRQEAFQGNEEGWTHQMKLIEKYLATS